MYENQYEVIGMIIENVQNIEYQLISCLLYTSDAADD